METNNTTQNRTPQSDSANTGTPLTDKDIEALKLLEGTYVRLAEDTKDGFIPWYDFAIEFGNTANERGLDGSKFFKLMRDHYPNAERRLEYDEKTDTAHYVARIYEDNQKYLHELGRQLSDFIADYNRKHGWMSLNLLNSTFPEALWRPFGFDDAAEAFSYLCYDEFMEVDGKEIEDDYLLHIKGVPMPEETPTKPTPQAAKSLSPTLQPIEELSQPSDAQPKMQSSSAQPSLQSKDIEVLKLIEGTYVRLAEDTKDGFIKKDDLVIEVNDLAQKRGITDDRAWKLLGEHYPDRIEKFVADDITHLVETMVRIKEDDLKYLHELGKQFLDFIAEYNRKHGWMSFNLLNSTFPEALWRPFGFDVAGEAFGYLCDDEIMELDAKKIEDDYLLHIEGVPMPEEATAEQVTTEQEQAGEPEQQPTMTEQQPKPERKLSTKLTWDQQAQAYLLVEGAYAAIASQPGNWKKLADVEARYTELAERQGISGTTFMAMLKGAFPDVKFIDEYRHPEGGDPFKAVRITPNKLKVSNGLRAHIKEVIQKTSGPEGWTNLAALGNASIVKDCRPIKKAECQQLGFRNLKEAIIALFGKDVEFKDDIMVRLVKGSNSPTPAPTKPEQAPTAKPDKTPIIPDKTPSKPEKSTDAPINGSSYLLSESLKKWAYFPGHDEKLNWTAAINQLAKLAISERWYFDDKDEATKPILRNYISNTFERLQEEDAKEMERVEGTTEKPQLKILANKQYAIWNTGLVNNIYDPIYAIFTRNTREKEGKQKWVFKAFNTANTNYQNVFATFKRRPYRAQFHEDPRDLVYDTRAEKPTLDIDHIIFENIGRLPIGFLKKGCTQNFQFIDNAQALDKEKREAYYERLKKAINDDDTWKLMVTTQFKAAVKVAIARVRWNYTAAIPIYYKSAHKIQHLLPLALEKKGKADVALVCEHVYDELEGVNNYMGKTILTLDMAYNDARLITRPDSGWLMSDNFFDSHSGQ